MSSDYYVTNKQMIVEIKKYQDSKCISNELGKMILSIATNFANKSNFAGYTWKEDMIGEAVYTCVRYIHNFDVKKEGREGNINPFGYFTKIIYHSFINYIKKQKKHSDIKDICYNNILALDDEQYIEKGINYETLK